ncbi:MAG TPA: hypothetical protein VIM98_15805 [Dyella sp.]|uniref:hypothetical protein n=1 Tax=Dyella sp. TaxID=1869338 RepID=UPI002F925E29
MMARCLALALLGGSAACLLEPAQAQSASGFGGEVALASQLADRGIAITPARPTIQAAINWTSPKGWTFGVAGGSELDSPRLAESLAQVARSWSLSNDWQMQTSLFYYHYAGPAHARVYDRTEAAVTWIYRDILSLGVSGIYAIGAKEQRLRPALDLNARWPLAWNVSVSAGVGTAEYVIASYRPTARYDHVGFYGYGHAGLSWSQGPWRVELSRVATDPSFRRHWGELAASSWLATAAWSF